MLRFHTSLDDESACSFRSSDSPSSHSGRSCLYFQPCSETIVIRTGIMHINTAEYPFKRNLDGFLNLRSRTEFGAKTNGYFVLRHLCFSVIKTGSLFFFFEDLTGVIVWTLWSLWPLSSDSSPNGFTIFLEVQAMRNSWERLCSKSVMNSRRSWAAFRQWKTAEQSKHSWTFS